MQPAPTRDAAATSAAAESNTASAAVADAITDIFAVVEGMARSAAMIDGLRVEAIAQAIAMSGLADTGAPVGSSMSRELRLRSLRAELALVLRIPEATAESMLFASEKLVRDLPTTLDALKAGEITYRHAQVLVDQVHGLDAEGASELERDALPFARALTVAKFTRKLRVLRESLNPESITDRHQAATERREVTVDPAADGMAWLSAYLPAAQALGILDRLTGIAKSLQSREEPRTLTQLRADVLCDLLIDGEPTMGSTGIRPKVFVTVPVLTLLGVQKTPATLDGYGPIDPDTARDLARNAPSFTRLLTHPVSGVVLAVGRNSYAVPADLKAWLQLRDGTCRFPGCSRSASRSDIDHTVDWAQGGSTEHDNLAHLCRGHHTLKHQSPWKVAHADGGGGVLIWTSPTGRNYTTQPEMVLRT